MNSEKVKEIKEYLQEEVFIATKFEDKLRRIPTRDLQNLLTLINELESENERLKWEKQTLEDKDTLLAKVGELSKENQQFKDRIVELEKELTNNRVFYKDGICYPMNCQGALKQFAERLKEDFTKKKNKLIKEREIAIKYDDFILIDALAYKIDELQYAIDNIDETLKEFTT